MQNDKQDLTQSVLVTGCSTGFGMETALYLAERNFQVYASMRNLTQKNVLLEKAAQRQVNLRVLQLDITDQHSIEHAVRQVVAEAGGIFGLVNNAGVFVRGFFEDVSEDEIWQVFEPNLFGTMALTRAVIPHMRAVHRGRVVIVTSVAGRIGSPTGSVYAASRFAQEGFGESLYQELAPLGVQVVLVEPGMTKTEHYGISDQGVAVHAKDPSSPYFRWFTRANQLFNQTMDTSPIKTSDVAKVIYQALNVRRPRLRYLVGRRASFVLGLRRYIPGEVFERIYFSAIMNRITRGKDI